MELMEWEENKGNSSVQFDQTLWRTSALQQGETPTDYVDKEFYSLSLRRIVLIFYLLLLK